MAYGTASSRFREEPSHPANGDQLTRQAVIRDRPSRRKRNLFIGREVSFRLVVEDVPPQADPVILVSPELPQSLQMIHQGPIVEMVLEPGHPQVLAAGGQTRPDDPFVPRSRQDAARKQFRPVAIIRVTPETIGRDPS